MTNDLGPCPFCGGDAKEFTGEDAAPHRWTVECDSCGAHVGSDTRHKARAKWNRRAERTCRDTDYDTGSITCSECGEITRNTLFWAEVDGGWTVKGHRPRFCSNCGARVVKEEA